MLCHGRTCYEIGARPCQFENAAGRIHAGETKEAWVVDYVDQGGARHLKTFARKREADAWHAIVASNVRAGIHTADSKSLTVAKAGHLWIESGEAAKLERTTLESYRTLLDHAHRSR